RDFHVTGVQTCALPIWRPQREGPPAQPHLRRWIDPVADERHRLDVRAVRIPRLEPQRPELLRQVLDRALLAHAARRAPLELVRRSEERRVGKEGGARWP